MSQAANLRADTTAEKTTTASFSAQGSIDESKQNGFLRRTDVNIASS